jgi:cell division protein FtsA
MSATEANEQYIVIYVGTGKLVLLEGGAGSKEPRIKHCEMMTDPAGFENGLVTNLERATHTLELLAGKSSQLQQADNRCVYVVLGNSKLKSYSFSSSQYYQGGIKTVTPAEIRAVIEQTQSVSTLPLSEHVLQAIPESFLVNDMPGIRNPLGLEANRLGVMLRIFTMNYQDHRNIAKAFDAADLEVIAYYPKTLTVSEAILSAAEKEQGAVIVDISEDATEFILWKGGNLFASQVCPAGASFLVQRIASEWGIEQHDAMRVRDTYASLNAGTQFGEELIPLIERNGKTSHPIRRQDFQQKFILQCSEWIECLLKETDRFITDHKVLHPHYVFTGSGVQCDGFLEFLQSKFARDGRIGLPHGLEASNELMMDSSMPAALGMFRCFETYEREREKFSTANGFFAKTAASVRGWFSDYF